LSLSYNIFEENQSLNFGFVISMFINSNEGFLIPRNCNRLTFGIGKRIMRNFLKTAFLLGVAYFFPIYLLAQVITIQGHVREAGSNEPVMFAHVFIKGLQAGTTSDTSGYYKLQFDRKGKRADSVTFSFMGYFTERVAISPNINQTIDVLLKPQFTSLGDLTVTAGDNPAWAMLDKIIDKRSKNNPESRKSYACEEYSKIRFDLNHFTEKIKENILVRPFEFLWNDVDTTADGVPFLPVLLVEKSISHYYQSDPKKYKDVVNGINATGLKGPQIMRFVEDLYLSPNIYDDFVVMLDKSFPSPLTSNYKLFYDHYLMDSLDVQGRKTYRMIFEPKHKRELAFTGEMLIDAESLAVVKVELRFDIMANVNFVRSYWVSQRFERVDGENWMIVESQVLGDFTVIENSAEMTGFFGRKNSIYKEYHIDEGISKPIFKGLELVVEADSARLRSNDYWEKQRYTELTEKEAGIFEMVKKIEKDPAFIFRRNFILAFVSGYVPWKKFDIGSFYSFYSYNPVEHSRLKFGFKTGKDFYSPLRFSAYTAYGFLDERWKYGGTADWNLTHKKKNPNRMGITYKYDIEQLGRSFNQLEIDHILTSLVQYGGIASRNYVTEANLYFESNITTGLLFRLGYFDHSISPTGGQTFTVLREGIGYPTKKFEAQGMSFLLKFSYQNRNISGQYYSNDDPKLTFRKFPDAALEIKKADNDFGSGIDFTKINFQLKQNIRLRSLGYGQYFIDVGKTYGTVPYPYLNIPFGNQLVFQDEYAFNLMNFLEFASDQYVAVYLQHHFGGLILDRIPLINKLKWRSFTFARGYWGSLSDKNNQETYLFPQNLSAIDQSYYEVGFGIENIFKIARVDFSWRLTDTNVPGSYYFIVKPSFKFSF
jgi:Family of unknown function (DUF5686)/CarboxypepD_reg-like domain